MALDWDKPLNEWTDEELAEGRSQMGEKDEGRDKKEKVTATLPDGSTIEADDYEALSKAMTARMGEMYEGRQEREDTPAPRQQPTPQAREQFVMDDFAKKFMSDPAEALEYLDKTKYGFSSKQALASALIAVDGLQSRVKEMEVERFLDNTEDYQPSQKNMKILTKVMEENNWPVTYKNLKNAYAIAKEEGDITVKAVKKAERDAPPPRLRSMRGENESSGELPSEIMDTARNMPIDKLEEFLFQKGALKTRRFQQ